jgi:hypothetical protein
VATYPGGIFSQADVDPGDTLGSATPPHRTRENAVKNEVIAMQTELGVDPADLDDTTTVTLTPTTVKEKTDVLARRITDIIGAFDGAVSLTLTDVFGKFNNTTGHKHTGASGDAPKVPFTVREVDGTPSVEATILELPNGTLSNPSTGIARYTAAGGGGGGSLTVQEVDGTPSDTPTILQFPNGTLSVPTAGTILYTPAGGGGGGGGPAYTVPGSMTGWAWDVQGGSTITANTDAWDMTTNVADGIVHAFYQAYPTPPFTVVAGIKPPLMGTNFISAGIGFSQGTGRMYLFYIGMQDGFWYVRVDQWDAYNSFHSRLFNVVAYQNDVMLFKIEDDNTNTRFSIAHDLSGQWQEVYYDARTAWVAAADRLHYQMQASTACAGHSRLVHWDVS